MWAYLAAYEMPADDPAKLQARVRVTYPVTIDRALGLGVPPSLRLQRALAAPGRIRAFDKPFVWAHWIWFLVPHGSIVYHLVFHRDRFPRAVSHLYGTFDIGLIGYWVLPTAPPWYAAERGKLNQAGYPPARRMMVEYGQEYWGDRWPRLYGSLGGNPLAAMPSLHFATSLMAAHLLTDIGPVEGAVGWTYALTLGFALVYLGEHYVIDLVAGAALTEGVRAAAPRLGPAFAAVSQTIQRLEAVAHRE
jgi:membrane-associated phospholipid phosphatase